MLPRVPAARSMLSMLDSKTLRATMTTIAVVVCSKTWDVLFTNDLFPMIYGYERVRAREMVMERRPQRL